MAGESDLVLADLTEQNANVMWELGVACGLKKRFILVATSSEPKDIPFDLRSYFIHIYPDNPKQAVWKALSNTAQSYISKPIIGGPVAEALGRDVVHYGEPLFWKHAAAIVTDNVLILIAIQLIDVAFSIDLMNTNDKQSVPLYYRSIFVLFFLSTWIYGATPGKFVMKLRVVDSLGEKPGFFRTLWRTLAYFLDIITMYVGFLMALFGPQYRTLHDRVSGTAVISNDIRQKNSSSI